MVSHGFHPRAQRESGGAVSTRETVNGFVRVFAKTRDIPGNFKTCNFLTAQERNTLGNPVKYFEVLAGAISWGFKSPSPHQT